MLSKIVQGIFKAIGLDGVFDFKSKTFWGVLIGALGILLDVPDLLPGGIQVPELVPQLAEVIGFIVTTMGLRDKMLDSKSTIIAKLIDVKSRTFIGALIVGISYIVDNVGSMPIPEKYVPVIQIFGALLTAMGIRDAKGKQLRKGVA